ncbi:peptidylprolyl isomerase [Melaminivora alkalimesophila]|nr:peptidylprolyl isomerase [Melaminivora alkalimesophila]
MKISCHWHRHWAALVLATSCAGVAVAQDAVLMQTPGGAQVTEKDLAAELQRVPPQARANVLAKPDTVQLILKTLMVRRLLAQEAEANGLAATPEVQALRRINDERVLSEARMLQVDADNEADEAALESYARGKYQAEAKRFEVPAQTHARHILIAGEGDESRARAEALLAELKGGADFEELAKEHSQDPGSGRKGGDLGFFPEGRMVPEFDAALKAMEPGGLSEPVKTQFGWHLIQLVERRPADKRPFEEVREELMREARTRILGEKRAAKAAALLKDAEYKDDAIQAFADKMR